MMKFRSPIHCLSCLGLSCLGLALLLSGCGGQASSANAVKLQGAGASFPAPL
ncbi:MAG: hypothetical protein ABI868_15025 [Acidobacteriota bacterium]